jgi:predicted acylesterase/phospholipase RssA
MTDAIILGGGGSKVAFALGVLVRLYELGIRPAIIFGASAGAVSALKLAEAPQDPLQPHRICEILRGADGSNDFYLPRPWLSSLLSKLIDVTPDRSCGVSPRQLLDLATALFVSPVSATSNVLLLIRSGLRLRAVRDALKAGMHDGSLFSLSPIASLMRAMIDEAAVRVSPAELFIAVTHYRTGELRFVSKDGMIHDRNLNPLADTPAVSLIDATVASSSLPVVFQPTKLGADLYVDGSVRGNMPIRAAVRRGATRIFAILLTPAPVVPVPPGIPALADILQRVPEIMIDEMVFQELQLPGTTVQMIAPLQNMHSGLEFDPGLISIDIDYGYVRAGDCSGGASVELVAITEELFRLRYEAWLAEAGAAGPEHAAIGVATKVRQLKRAIAAAAIRRRDLGGVMPAGFEKWWLNWERHCWQPAYPSPWHGHNFAAQEMLLPEEPPFCDVETAVSRLAVHSANDQRHVVGLRHVPTFESERPTKCSSQVSNGSFSALLSSIRSNLKPRLHPERKSRLQNLVSSLAKPAHLRKNF